ncbi:MAG: MFS transporter, partial [Chloroflexota bacterium]
MNDSFQGFSFHATLYSVEQRPRTAGTDLKTTQPGDRDALEPTGGRETVDLRILAPLALTAFVGMINNFAFGPFLPSISRELGTSVPILGQVATATFFMTAFGGLFVGPLADHFGHRRMMVVGLTLALTSAAGTALAPDFWTLLAARMAGGAAGSVASGVTLAAAGTLFAGDARRRALSIVTATVAGGVILGAPTLTSVGAWVSWRGAFGLVAAAAACILIFFIFGFPADKARASWAGISVRQMVDSYRPLIAERRMFFFFGGSLLQAVAWAGPFTYLGAFLEDAFAFSTQEIGYGYMMAGAGFFTGSLIGGGRMRGLGLVPIFALTTATLGVLWALILIFQFHPVASLG